MSKNNIHGMHSEHYPQGHGSSVVTKSRNVWSLYTDALILASKLVLW
jgi:hypothetical protein